MISAHGLMPTVNLPLPRAAAAFVPPPKDSELKSIRRTGSCSKAFWVSDRVTNFSHSLLRCSSNKLICICQDLSDKISFCCNTRALNWAKLKVVKFFGGLVQEDLNFIVRERESARGGSRLDGFDPFPGVHDDVEQRPVRPEKYPPRSQHVHRPPERFPEVVRVVAILPLPPREVHVQVGFGTREVDRLLPPPVPAVGN